MKTSLRAARPGWTFYAAVMIVSVPSFLLHELGHWGAGEALGIDMWMSLNKAGPVSGVYQQVSDHILIALGGPAVTGLIAVLAYAAVLRWRSKLAYAVLFFQFMFRLIATGLTLVINRPQDEAAAGILLGIGPLPLSLAVLAILFALTWDAARRLRVGIMPNALAYVVASVAITAIVFSGQALLDAGVKWF